MKKPLFTVLLSIVIALLLLPLSGCNRYTSHYKATVFVHTNTAKNASMSFSSFEGSMVFKMKCESEDEKINYSAILEDGSATVFYDCNGTKTELISVRSGDTISAIGATLQKGTVYIIVETSQTCKNGRFSFDIIKD